MPESVLATETAAAAPPPSASRRFKVALSFPGEHRALVDQIASGLALRLEQKVVFYDKYFEAELARPNLDTYLQAIYHDQTELLVIFLCAAFDRKKWCGLEWRAIRDVMAAKKDEAIMFIRIDSAKVAGVFDGIDGWIDVEGKSPEEIVLLILDRLQIATGQPTLQDADKATIGLVALSDLMASPAVKAAVAEYDEQLRETSKQINILNQYKSVHDQLHSLQVFCYIQIWQEFRRFPEKPVDWDKLEEYGTNLDNVIYELRNATEEDCFTEAEKGRLESTVKTLERSRDGLATAVQQKDPKELESTAQQIRRVLGTQPDYFSTNLTQRARNLHLENLAEAMTNLYHKLSGYKLDKEKLGRFEEGLAAIGRLSEELNKMIGSHDRWQEFDTNLRRIDEVAAQQFKQELQWSWEDLKDLSRKLDSGGAESWEAQITAKTAELDEWIRSQPLDKVVYAFQKYRGWAVQRFYRVDRDLLKHCDKLCKVGKPLDSILEKN